MITIPELKSDSCDYLMFEGTDPPRLHHNKVRGNASQDGHPHLHPVKVRGNTAPTMLRTA